MLQQTLLLEDCVLIASYNDGLWDVGCSDYLSGKTVKVKMNSQELAIITALGIGGEDLPEEIRVPMYKLAEEIVKEWPIEVRPFR